MGRISHHLTGKDYKKTRQLQLGERVSLYRKIIKKEIEKIEDKKFLEYFKSNWRKELKEQMTSSELFSVTLEPTGDIQYLPLESEVDSVAAGPFRSGTAVFDTRTYDTMIIDVEVNDIAFAVLDSNQNFLFLTLDGSGTYSFSIPQGKEQLFYFAGTDEPTAPPGMVSFNVTGVRFQRRSPLNVLIGLDDPEAVSFIRTGTGNLTAKERQQKLRELLEASDEYVMEIFGSDFPGTNTTPPGERGTTPGVNVTNVDDLSNLDDIIAQTTPSPTGSGRMPYGTPGGEKPFQRQGYKDSSGKFVDFDDPSTWPSINNVKQA